MNVDMIFEALTLILVLVAQRPQALIIPGCGSLS
jgi:hypothetical protein